MASPGLQWLRSRARAYAPVVGAVLLVGCGSSAPGPSTTAMSGTPTPSTTTGAEVPYGIGAVTWPADDAGVNSLLTRMPKVLQGLPLVAGSDAMADTSWLGYGPGFIDFQGPTATQTVAVTVATAKFIRGAVPVRMRTPGTILMLMWGLGYGCKAHTDRGSLPVNSRKWYTTTGQFLWFECTVDTVEGAGTLTPAQYRYIGGWAGPDLVAYLIDAPNPQLREAMAQALVSAVR
ncbi:MAG: hypothetical protein WAN48_03600 [Actinomycetes bacterium]